MLMILLGCAAVGPDYRAPEAQTQAGFTYAAQPGLSNDAVEVAWWRSFQDPLLTRFIETALSANHDLRIATASLREAGLCAWKRCSNATQSLHQGQFTTTYRAAKRQPRGAPRRSGFRALQRRV